MSRGEAPRTSVIVPVRNAASTLARTLDCLLAQHDPDWEALLVDDRSEDGSGRIIARYVQRDARFIALDGPGAGASAARNTALARARGRRVLFLDSDDWLDARFLATMNAALDGNPDASAAYCGFRRVMPDGSLTPLRSDPRVAAAPFDAFARRCASAIHGVLVAREALERAGGFDPSLRTCEDWDLWQRVARLGAPWVHVDEALSFYRVGEHTLARDLDRLLGDARVVIGRGFSADPRLDGVPAAHAHGASGALGGTQEVAYAYFALWCAAFACGTQHGETGAGAQGRATLDAMAPLRPLRNDAAALVEVLFEGVMVGARLPAERLAVCWPRYGSALCALVAGLGRLWDDALAARRIQYRFERLVLDYDDLAAPRPLGLTLGLRVDLRDPQPVQPRDGIDRFYAYLCDGEKVEAVADFGASGPVSGQRWHELARRLGARCGTPSPSRAPASGERLRRLGRRVAQGLRRLRPTAPAAFWEAWFATPDPWHYDSDYEREKYAHQLALLPAARPRRALELACAEGHFTRMLAPRVERLLACDISRTALARARRRCAAQRNVDFRRMDLVRDRLPRQLDLVVCSEVLYYVEDDAQLHHVAQRLAQALRPGGHLISAHAFVLAEDCGHTGFDWGERLGAKRIAAAFEAIPGLALERSVQTELYRVDRYVRLSAGQTPALPAIEACAMRATLEPEVERRVVWGGASALRHRVQASERRDCLPVLTYHRVAVDGPHGLRHFRVSPEAFHAQMRWLRRNGYHSVVSDEIAWFLERRHPFVGRPVLISFDDGFQDFADAAWPVLRAHDLRPEVFVVTDLAGRCAEWDRQFGDPAPLMDADTIRRLAGEGVCFGSHLATHRPADALPSAELEDELQRSRDALSAWLGYPVRAFAAPFGATDARVRSMAAMSGYAIGYSTRSGPVRLDADPLDLPRIEVHGSMHLDAFAAALEACR